jgi:hypothetical protein
MVENLGTVCFSLGFGSTPILHPPREKNDAKLHILPSLPRLAEGNKEADRIL